MRLTVLSVAYSLAPVGAPGAGGAEEVLSQLDRALVDAGHRSLVVAWRGSSVAGTLLATAPERGPFDGAARARARQAQRHAIAAAFERFSVDVVHVHGLDFDEVLPKTGVPAVVTLHLPVGWYAPGALEEAASRAEFVAVTREQAAALPPQAAVHVVENGVPLDAYAPAPVRGDYVLVLGRICEEKGQHLALDAGRRAGVPVVLSGPLAPYPEHVAYFRDDILPRLDEHRRYLGPTRGVQKARLIARAQAVVVPSLAPETSSLVAMEALASGTPVIAFRSGALARIVEHGVTGLLVDNVTELGAALGAVHTIDPGACRRAAEARFSAARMTREYLTLYQELVARGAARAAS